MTTQAAKDSAVLAAHTAVDNLAALVTVDVVVPPSAQFIVSFTATPSVTPAGGSVVLAWNTEHSTRVLLDGALVPEDGSATIIAAADATHTLIVSGSAPDVSGGVFVDVQEPVPVQTGLLPSVGGSMYSGQFAHGPADWIDVAKLPAPVPWNVYTDPATKTLAPSNNGVRPARWKRIHPWGAISGLYSQIPILKNGSIVQYTPHLGTFPRETITPSLKANPPPVGARGVGLVDPYITWHGHRTTMDVTQVDNPHPIGLITNPRMPLYIGLRLDGAMLSLMRDGSSYIMGWIDGTNSPMDWSYFKPNSPNRQPGDPDTTKIFFIADTYNGRILKVDRHAAAAAQVKPGIEDYKLWTVTVFASGLGDISSIRCLPTDGTMYACDNSNHRILKITPDGVVSTLLNISLPWFVDYTSDGKLAVITSTRALYVIDPMNPVLGPNLNASLTHNSIVAFLTVSVDRNGTIGPRDEMYVCWVSGPSNTDFWRISPTGIRNSPIGKTHYGRMVVGEVEFNEEPGHYPWVLETHPDEGILLAQGFSNPTPSLYMAMQPGDPPLEPYNHNLFSHGQRILNAGTTSAMPVGSRPSFTSQMSRSTHSLLGVSGDYIARMSYADAAQYVQRGMSGSFPRPEIVGYDLYAFLYLIYTSSQRYLLEGRALIDGLRAWMAANYPGYATPTTKPSLPFADEMLRNMVARKEGTGVIVSVVNKYGFPVAMDPAIVVRVVADKGMPAEKIIGTVSTPWKIAGPLPLSIGQHALTCELVSGGSASYWNRTQIVVV